MWGRHRTGDVVGRRPVPVKTLGADLKVGAGSFNQTPYMHTAQRTIVGAFLGCWLIGLVIGAGIPRIVNICDPAKCIAEVGCPGGVPVGQTEACQLQAAACHCSKGVPPAGHIYPDWPSSLTTIALLVATAHFFVRQAAGYFSQSDYDLLHTLSRWILAWWNTDEPLQSWTRVIMIFSQFAGFLAGELTSWPLQPTSAGGDRRSAYFNGGYALGAPDVAYEANPGTDGGSTEAGIFYLMIFFAYAIRTLVYLSTDHQFQSSAETKDAFTNTPGDKIAAPRNSSNSAPSMYMSFFGRNIAIMLADVGLVLAFGGVLGPFGLWSRDLAAFSLLGFPTADGGRFPGILYVGYLVIPFASLVFAVLIVLGLSYMTYETDKEKSDKLHSLFHR